MVVAIRQVVRVGSCQGGQFDVVWCGGVLLHGVVWCGVDWWRVVWCGVMGGAERHSTV